jgi:2-polyprenyl-6-methoxyphenol hydroxylase-like FAD-dependent oxidoreductase
MTTSVAVLFSQLAEARPPERSSVWFDTACVLGGSVAGLLAARVLSDHARKVIVIERDAAGIDGGSRAGVPQDRQVHVLLAAGQRWLERWLPGFTSDLQDHGAVLVGAGQLTQYRDGRGQTHGDEYGLLSASRPLIEARVRARVLSLPNVSAIRSQVTGLAYHGGRVAAVRHRSGPADHLLSADLVVDAMGRGSRLAHWLDDDGYDRPPLERLPTAINYASALFRRKPDARSATVAFYSPPYPVDGVAVAGANPIEREQWLVLLMGYDGSNPGQTIEAFQATCAKLPPVFPDASEDPAVGEVFTYHQADSRRRQFAGLGRFPAGLIAVGDAVASFNPIYGQGMSAAALHASCLSEYLSTQPDLKRSAAAFFELEQIVVDAAWRVSAGGDAARLDARDGTQVPEDVARQRRVMEQLMQASQADESVARAVNEVLFMLAHPDTLADPALLERAVAANEGDKRTAPAPTTS